MILLSSASSKQNNLQPDILKWVIVKGGILSVTGNTNVNNFNCDISNYTNPDTIIIDKNSIDKMGIRMLGNINLDVGSFDCHHAIMTSDLRKTLKVKEFPNLRIKFLSLSKFPDLNVKQDILKGMVEIKLAGITKRFEVSYKLFMDGNNIIHLVGNQNINFTDFEITPPRKVGGMIKTDNKLAVEFRLKFKTINPT
jgi:hypothetical protein